MPQDIHGYWHLKKCGLFQRLFLKIAEAALISGPTDFSHPDFP